MEGWCHLTVCHGSYHSCKAVYCYIPCGQWSTQTLLHVVDMLQGAKHTDSSLLTASEQLLAEEHKAAA